MREDKRYDITIDTGTDYILGLSFVEDDESEIENYGVRVFLETIYDGSGSVYLVSPTECIELHDGWRVEDETLIYEPQKKSIIDGRYIEAQLREFPESNEAIDFEVSYAIDGFYLNLSNDETKRIPYTRGYYDIFMVDDSDGSRTKLLSGRAIINRRVTREYV